MRKGIAVVISIAAVSAALVSISAGGASASNSRPTFKPWGHSPTAARGGAALTTADGVQRLVLNTKSGQFKPIDADHSGSDSVGDYFLFTETLWNAGGDRIGNVRATCTHHFNGSLCQASIRLAGRGTLQVAGLITRRNGLLAVTGGTGDFSDAGGEMDTSADNGGTTGQLVISLRHLA